MSINNLNQYSQPSSAIPVSAPASSSSTSNPYIDTFSESDRRFIYQASQLNVMVYDLREDTRSLEPLLNQGIEIFDRSDRNAITNFPQARAEYDQIIRNNRNDIFEILTNLSLREQKLQEIEVKTPILHSMEAKVNGFGYFGLCVLDKSSNTLIISNEGTHPNFLKALNRGDIKADAALFFNLMSNYTDDAIAFARQCKVAADQNGYKIVYTGHSLGGYLAHLQMAVVGGDKTIAFDNPLITEEIVRKYADPKFLIDDISNDCRYITIKSNRNFVNTSTGKTSYGIEIKVDVIGTEEDHWNISSHDMKSISEELNNEINVTIHRFVTTYPDKTFSFIPTGSISSESDRKIFSNRLIDTFQTNAQELMQKEVNVLSEVNLLGNEPPEEIDIDKIELVVNVLNEEDAKQLNHVRTSGEESATEMESELKGPKKEEILIKMTQTANDIATELYLDSQLKLAEKKVSIEINQMIRGFAAQKEHSDARHDQEIIVPSFPSLERAVFSGIHPSGNLRRHLKAMGEFVKNYREMQVEIQELLHQRKELKANLNHQRDVLDRVDRRIQHRFNTMIDYRRKAIRELGRASTALGIAGSVISLGITVIKPAYAAIPTAIGGLGQNALGMGRTHHEKRLMQVQDSYRQYLEYSQGIRNGLAEQSYQNNCGISQLEQEQLHGIKAFMQSGKQAAPKDFRKQLRKDQAKLLEIIEEKNKEIKGKRKERDQLREKRDGYQQILDRPKELEDEIEEKEKDLKKVNPASKKWLRLNIELSELNSELKKLKKQNKDKVKLKISELDEELTALDTEIGTRGKAIEELENDNRRLQNLRFRERRVAAISDYFHEAGVREANRWGPNNEADEDWQDAISDGIALVRTARARIGNVVTAATTELDKFFQELAYGPLLPFISKKILSEENYQKLSSKICRVPLYLQTGTKILEQGYKIVDSYAMWKLGSDAFDMTFESIKTGNPMISIPVASSSSQGTGATTTTVKLIEPTPANPDATFLDAIKKFGPLNFVANYILPGVQIISGGLTMLRLLNHFFSGCPRTQSPEEMMLIKIGDFLTNYTKQLDAQIVALHEQLDKNHAEVIENLTLIRSDMSILSSEIIYEIEQSRDMILGEQRETTYNDHTVRTKTIGENIVEKRTGLALDLMNSKIKSKVIYKYYRRMIKDLVHKSRKDINTGISYGQGETETSLLTESPLVKIEHVKKNPDHYTGLIASAIGFNYHMSSLYLFNELFTNYQFANDRCQRFLENPVINRFSDDCATLLKGQGQVLMQLCQQIDCVITRSRITQDECLNTIQNHIKTIRSINKGYTDGMLLNAKERWLQEMNQSKQPSFFGLLRSHLEKNKVGHQKFCLAEIFCKSPLRNSYIPHKRHRNQEIRNSIIGGIANSLFFFYLAPVIVPANIIQGIINIDKYDEGQLFLSLKNDERTVSDLLRQNQRQKELRYRPDYSEYHQKIIEDGQDEGVPNYRVVKWHSKKQSHRIMKIWLSADGALSTSFEHDYGVDPIRNYKNTKDNAIFRAKLGRTYAVKVVIPHTERSGLWGAEPVEELQDLIKVYDKTSLITLDEVNKLFPNIHTVSTDEYNTQLNQLMSDYEQIIVNPEGIAQGNCFYEIKGKFRLIESSDPTLDLLMFPEELLLELENRMNPDRIQMETTGVGFLYPTYSFKKATGTDSYRLSIQYDFVDKEKPAERSLYREFEIAVIDENTVKAFSKPTFSKDDKSKPNLNEFLLQAMYTGFVHTLGMPGDQSVSLGQNKWIAPAERPFPGFYKLWKQFPNCSVNFNSRYYTETLSREAMEAGEGAMNNFAELGILLRQSTSNPIGMKINLGKKIREMKDKLVETKNKMEENYNRILVYCRLITKLDDFSLKQKLETNLGLYDPVDFSSLYDLVIQGSEFTPIDENELNMFKTVVENIPSDAVARLRNAMDYLEGTKL